MSWTLISVVLFFILFYTLDRRMRRLEENRGNSYSQHFSINALKAVLANKMFGKLSKIKSSEEGKPYEDWTESERNKWHKGVHHKIVDKVYVHVTYLASENAFFIKTKDTSGLVLNELHKTCIYSSFLIGELSNGEDYLEFGLFNRIANYGDKKIRVISGYLTEGIGSLTKDYNHHDYEANQKTQILFDFPLDHINWTDEDLKTLGFEIERYEPSLELQSAGYKDIFGETEFYDTSITYKKNGVEIYC